MTAVERGESRRRLRHLVLPAVAGLLLLIVLVLPDLGPRIATPEIMTAYHARIIAMLDPHRPDPSAPGSGFLPDARVLVLEGPRAGQEVDAYLEGPGGQQDNTGYRLGEDVVVTFNATGEGESTYVAVQDRW